MVDISLDLLNESLSRVGKRELEAEELKQFVIEVLKHETKYLRERKELFEKEQIKENEINQFDFFTDGYHSGLFIHLDEDSMYSVAKDEEGNDTPVKRLPKKKDGVELRDENGEVVYTDRCYMRLKTRVGGMSIFLGMDKVETLDIDHSYVLVGGLTVQHKVANSDEYHREKKKEIEYTATYYTLNLWQIAEVIKKAKGINLEINFDCNWKKEDEEKS